MMNKVFFYWDNSNIREWVEENGIFVAPRSINFSKIDKK